MSAGYIPPQIVPESELIADKFKTLTEAQLDAEEARIERGRQCAQRKQDLARYNRRLTALTAERMRRVEAATV